MKQAIGWVGDQNNESDAAISSNPDVDGSGLHELYFFMIYIRCYNTNKL